MIKIPNIFSAITQDIFYKTRVDIKTLFVNSDSMTVIQQEPSYKKPSFGNQPVLFLIQGCYFQEQPEKFLKL